MYRYAQLDDTGLVVGVLHTYSGPASSDDLIELSPGDPTTTIGARWNGESFEPALEPTTEPTWKITKLAFKNRFPRSKWIAAKVAAQSSPVIADFFETFDLASYIDLQRQDTISDVQSLTSETTPESFRLTAEEFSAVIETPAKPEEIPML